MQIIRNLPLQHPLDDAATILTIGSYDGIHRGHKRIIAEVKRTAAENNVRTVMVTFFPRPKVVLGRVPDGHDYLTTVSEKIWLLEKLGLDIVVLLPFTLEFAKTPAETFIRQLVDNFHPLALWVGPDFKLGKGRAGDIPSLRELGKTLNYTVNVINEQIADNQIISSTRIREAVERGNVRDVAHLLGAYLFLRGIVMHGAERGRTIGFPTANVDVPPEKLLPANGVYAVWAHVDGVRHAAVANIGIRPTFDELERTVEVYIFDFTENIYGKMLHVEWVERLRTEQKFDDISALIAQIQTDVAHAKTILATETPLGSV